MKRVVILVITLFVMISNFVNCFAADANSVKYPVKVNIFKADVDFSKEKMAQTITFKADSDVAKQLSVSIVDTSFGLQNGKTIFTEASKNSELEKYLSFTYNPTVDIVSGGTDVNITVTAHDLPDGVFYKGIKVSYATKTTVSSVLIPVIINNLVPGKPYITSARIDYVKIDGDYVVQTPFEVCIGIFNDGDKGITNMTGEFTITDANGSIVGNYPITSNTIFFTAAPKELRIPVTDNLPDGTYSAEAKITYDSSKPAITGRGNFEVKTNLSNSIGKTPVTVVAKTELPIWFVVIVVGMGLLIIMLIILLIMRKIKDNKNTASN